MATNQKYTETVFGIRYGWNIDDMKRPKTKAENDI